MPNINKPFYALAYSALGAALPPMAFKAAEIVSGFSFSSVIWKLVWLVSIVSFIILAGSLLYIIIYVVPIEKLIYKAIHPIVCIFAGKDEVGTSSDATKSTEEISAANHSKDQTEEQFAQMAEDPLDERHAMFLPYVNEDCKELPSMPILDILDEVFKGNRQKKDVGTALYCAKSLKWISSFPPHKQMAAVFGEEIVGSSSNFATYMPPIREIDRDYSRADNDFLVEVRGMKTRLRKAAGIN